LADKIGSDLTKPLLINQEGAFFVPKEAGKMAVEIYRGRDHFTRSYQREGKEPDDESV
jgi:hypothetical protein